MAYPIWFIIPLPLIFPLSSPKLVHLHQTTPRHLISSVRDLSHCLPRLLIQLIKSKQRALVSYTLLSRLPVRNDLQMVPRRSRASTLQRVLH